MVNGICQKYSWCRVIYFPAVINYNLRRTTLFEESHWTQENVLCNWSQAWNIRSSLLLAISGWPVQVVLIDGRFVTIPGNFYKSSFPNLYMQLSHQSAFAISYLVTAYHVAVDRFQRPQYRLTYQNRVSLCLLWSIYHPL
jgi:hypothetical protein